MSTKLTYLGGLPVGRLKEKASADLKASAFTLTHSAVFGGWRYSIPIEEIARVSLEGTGDDLVGFIEMSGFAMPIRTWDRYLILETFEGTETWGPLVLSAPLKRVSSLADQLFQAVEDVRKARRVKAASAAEHRSEPPTAVPREAFAPDAARVVPPWIAQRRELARLYDTGVLTADEFLSKVRALLPTDVPSPLEETDQRMERFRELQDLVTRGVLTEGEYVNKVGDLFGRPSPPT